VIAQPGFVELMVKQYPTGKASTHLHLLAPGNSLTFITALKEFSWKANQFSQVYLVAGGAGITPIYQLICGILDNPNDKTQINLVFGVNTEQDLLLREEFDEYKRRFPDRFNYVYTVSLPAGENSLVRRGRVTEELLREVVKDASDKETKVFVCGPSAMEQSLVGSWGSPGILTNLGFAKEQIYQF
jgi:cytochrome-b5 reductase